MNRTEKTDYLPVDEALERILNATLSISETEIIPSKLAEKRVLAVDLNAQRDIPAFDNSAMDGYIFLTKDLENGQRKFRVDGEIRPENGQPEELMPGSCREIMTGARVPSGSYTVVPIEMIKEEESKVEVLELPGRNPIRRRGEGYKKGKRVLEKGTLIRPYEVGLMIESGNKNCSVKKRISIGIQVTGSEIDEDMNSNGPVLEGLIHHWPGVEAKQWLVLADNPDLVLERMKELKESLDIVVTTGGISMGKHDYILGAMEKLGAEVVVRKIQQKPGKPLTVTRLGDTLFFHLPGNPISAVFSAELYLKKAVCKMLGLTFDEKWVKTSTRLKNHMGEKTLFVPGKLILDDQNRLTVSSEGVMKSHLLQLYRDNNVYVRLNPETEYEEGDNIAVIPFSTTQLP